MTPTVVQQKELVSLCVDCLHRTGSFDYCAEHMGNVTEVGKGATRRPIVLTCTGYHREAPKPKAAAQGKVVDAR